VFHYLQEASAEIDTNPSLMTREEIRARMEQDAAEHLETLRGIATERNVRSDATTEVSEHPHRAILEAAERHCCDLIVMASHGRQGLGALLLGSETQKVLTHGHLPVLVWRG
jgi:nucleotide-binding universal stress UspA family protein